MDIGQRDIVLKFIKEIRDKDTNAIMRSIYRHDAIEDSFIAGFSPLEIIQYLSRAIINLEKEVNNNWRFLPAGIYGTGLELADCLERIVYQLNVTAPFIGWVDLVVWLVQYEKVNGFWENAYEDKDLEFFKNDARNLVSSLKGYVSRAEKETDYIVANSSSVESINNKYGLIKESIERTRVDAEDIVRKLINSEVESASIVGRAQALIQGLENQSEGIEKLIEREREILSSISSNIKSAQENHNEIYETLKEMTSNYGGIIANAKEKEQHILEQKDAIEKLRGFAADGALGGVFGRRSRILNITVWFWALASIGIAYVAGNWILEIVKANTMRELANGAIDWATLINNTLRSLPAVILVVFSLSQYTKERNVQEEYAFKEAVSMSITAYSAMIGVDEERTKMLITAVQGVYTPPVLAKPFRFFSFRTKDLSEIAKSLAETTKNVQAIAVDALKSKNASETSSKEDSK